MEIRARSRSSLPKGGTADQSLTYEAVEKVNICVRKPNRLLSYWELPEYMKDNEFILRYYRSEWTIKEALFSVFQLHNETLNVWTHLIGFLLFLALTLSSFSKITQTTDSLGFLSRFVPISSSSNISTTSDFLILGGALTTNLSTRYSEPPASSSAAVWPFYVFLAGAMICLLCSSACHLFSCHSHDLNIHLLRADYAGIAVMIIGSFFPPIYYIFQCEKHWQIIYLSGITAMGAAIVFALLSPALSSAKFRAHRAMLFCSMGLFGVIPSVHAVMVNWDNPRRNIFLQYECAMTVFYLIGTVFYISRVPERFRPGWFDLAGHSHQIFHVFVVLGALAHYGATLLFMDFRNYVGCLA